LPRQDGSQNGWIAQYEFYVSADGTNWGTAVASGTFAKDATEKAVSFTSKSGQYIRLRALSEVNGKPWTSAAEINALGSSQGSSGTPPPGLVSHANWSLKYVDSQETVDSDGRAVNAFDGNTTTFWHTQYTGANPPPPHEIQINLGSTYSISGFRYLPRQDGGQNGWVGQYEFYVSADGVNWGTPTATGTFAKDATEKQVSFQSKSGQFVRFRALSEVNGKPWTSMAELNVLAAGQSSSSNQAPTGVIDSPSSNVTISAGDSVSFAGTGTDPDNTLPLTYRWNFGASSGIPDSTAQDPGSVQFNLPGTYTVTFTVTDASGLADPTPATRTVTVQSPVNQPPPNTSGTIPQKYWSLRYVKSEELVGINGAAVNSFDGKSNTIWQTRWYEAFVYYPHEIQINLGGLYNITGFTYLPRQDGSQDGWINQYQFYVSTDGLNWGTAKATGSFAKNAAAKQITFSAKTGQFVRLVGLNEVNNQPTASMAELNVLGQCVQPSVRLVNPLASSLQTSSTLNVLANACLDSSLNAGWGVRFTLDGNKTIDRTTAPFQTSFTNLTKSEHTLKASIINNSGVIVSGSNTENQITRVGVGDYYVALGDSITKGSGDDIPSDDTSSDGRVTGGGYEPILNNLLTTLKGYPQYVAKEGVFGNTSGDGVVRISAVLAKHPNAQLFLVQYGTNDAPGLPSGKGLGPGDPGYAGSYKENMQKIINAVNAAGKRIALAKVPVIRPSSNPANLVVQDYNIVIDELVSDSHNRITVTPPDFYTYFSTRYWSEYSDQFHPNGTGYQSMANLWYQALNQ
jgi:lysophospholipase L1-like esterase